MELNNNKKSKQVNYKAIGIAFAVLASIAVFFLAFKFLNASNAPVTGPQASVGSAIDGGKKNYKGEVLYVDPDVKKQKNDQLVGQREDAAKKDKTHLESLPTDAKFIDPSQSGTDAQTALNTAFIPCVTSPYDSDGYDCVTKLDKNGFSKSGFDKNGFDKNGCNKDGKDVSGGACGVLAPKVNQSCIDKLDNQTCEELSKFDKDGYDANGCDRQGYTRAGYSCAAPFCDRQGFNKDGYNCSTGFGRDGFDKNGCDKEGYNRDGFNCKTGLNREGYDKDGFDKNGFNKEGCNRQGKDRNGNACGKKDDKMSLTASDMLWLEDEQKRKIAFTQEMSQIMNKTNISASIKVITMIDPEAEAKAAKAKEKSDELIASSDNKSKDTDMENDVVQVPVGTMTYSFFDASVNSDYPGMVRAKILGGPLDGALLTGKITIPFANLSYMPRNKLQATFDRMVYKRNTYKVDAIGLDLGTAADYIDATVDNHYFTRWGGLVGASFLKGFGNAVSTNQVTSNTDQYGNAAVIAQPLQTTQQQAKAALGEVGSELSSIAKSYFDRPPTVSKEEGEQMIIFFNSEIKDKRLPMMFSKDELVEHNMTEALNPNYLKNN